MRAENAILSARVLVSFVTCAMRRDIGAQLFLSILATRIRAVTRSAVAIHSSTSEKRENEQTPIQGLRVRQNGLVSAGLQRREAESVALGTPGVTRVVDSIAIAH